MTMTAPRLLACLAIAGALFLMSGCAASKTGTGSSAKRSTGGPPPPANREFRAAWVATVGNIDWPSRKGLTAEEQKQEAIAILDKSVEMNLNAIVFQCRTSADALYKSDIEPWSEFLTGEQGKDPGYDPLEFWVAEAHKRGLELHAWFNPFRAMYGGGKKETRSQNHVWNTNRPITKEYGNMLWMDPGEKEAEDITVNVFLDVVRRYDVDGIHIDDYFYPYQVTDPKTKKIVDFPDGPAWEKYQASGGTLGRADWRRDNINRMVRRIYEGVRAVEGKDHVKFGISPFGIWQPGYPQSVVGFNQFESLYADAKLWLNEGWLDYWTPQLYWKLSSPGQAYEHLLHWWINENTKGRHVWPGLFTSKVGDRPTPWPVHDVLNQVWVTQQTPGATGNVHFSMKALVQNREGLADALADGPYREPALVPASTWLDKKAPPAPRDVTAGAVDDAGAATTKPTVSAGRYPAGTQPATYPTTSPAPTGKRLWTGKRVSWDAGDGEEAFVWAVYALKGDRWQMTVVPGHETETVVYDDPGFGAVRGVYVAAVDRSGNESKRVKAKTAK